MEYLNKIQIIEKLSKVLETPLSDAAKIYKACIKESIKEKINKMENTYGKN